MRRNIHRLTTRLVGQMIRATRTPGLREGARQPNFESLEQRCVLSVSFVDINPDISSLGAGGGSGGRFNGLASVAGDNRVFYGASEWGGIYKTTDQGVTWTYLDGHMPQATSDVKVDPANTNRVYASSTYDGRVKSIAGIQVSTDAGANWINPLSAHINPGFDNTPQANFTASPDQVQELSAFGIAVRPDASQHVFVGTTAGLARSSDAGLTWTFVDPAIPTLGSPSPGNASTVWDVVVQGGGPSGQGIIDVICSRGHFRSTDGGNTWVGGKNPIANTNSDGVDNDQDTLIDEADEVNLTLPSPSFAASIAVSPDESYVIFTVVNTRIFESDDAGASWNEFKNPVAQGRIPVITTNQRTVGFDLWFGDVNLLRAPGTTGVGMGGPTRVGDSATWINANSGAHADAGDVVFDTQVATDAVPLIYTNDGGVYRNTSGTQSPTWVQPTVSPHAMWVYGMSGADHTPNTPASEDLYFTVQDNGLFVNTNAGAANPAPFWTNPLGADAHDVQADSDTILANNGLYGGRGIRLFRGGAGFAGGSEISNPASYPPDGQLAGFIYSDAFARFGPNQWVVVMSDCLAPNSLTDGQDNDFDGVTDEADEFNGCSGPNGGDGGVYVTNNINANPIVWTELLGVGPTPDPNGYAVKVAVASGVPTFYVASGTGVTETEGGNQLWKYTGAGVGGTWTRVDTNAGAGGFGVWTVDPNDPNRLYASRPQAPAGARIVSSIDGGLTWNTVPQLENLMTGGGAFKFQNNTGPLDQAFVGRTLTGYIQPSMFAFDPAAPNIIVAGGVDSGVFVSIDSGTSFVLVTDPFTSATSGIPHLPRPRFAYFDHEPSGEVNLYVGTVGRGVWRINISNFDLLPDRFELNDSIASSIVFGSIEKITERGLTVHNSTDVDYYQFTAEDTGKVLTNIFFSGLNGNIDLRVRDASGNVIATGTQSSAASGRDVESLVFPAVAQQRYYIEVFSALGQTNHYDLEIENIPSPIPTRVTLDQVDDTGGSYLDNVTHRTSQLHFTVNADLAEYSLEGIPMLTAIQAAAGNVFGAAVQVFDNGASVGFANAISGTNHTLWEISFNANLTSFPVGGPNAAGLLGYLGFMNNITAAVTIFDPQRNGAGMPAPVVGRSQMSPPLIVNVDSLAPLITVFPDLLEVCDSSNCPGGSPIDNITNINAPAFSGLGEANTLVRVYANGLLVGVGRVGSDASDGLLGDGLGHWEVTVEPLKDGVFQITTNLEDLAGNIGPISPALNVTIDTLPPQRTSLDLADVSDSGRDDKDNITNDLRTTLPGFLRFRVTSDPGTTVVIKDGNTIVDGPFLMPVAGFIFRDIATAFFPTDRDYLLSAEAFDVACNVSDQSEELDVQLDRTPPLAPTVRLHPSSDSGIGNVPTTLVDRITNDTTPEFVGNAEADALVRLLILLPGGISIDDGLTLSVPLDGNQAFGNGQWDMIGQRNLNDPTAPFPLDGLRQVRGTAEDRAGNLSAPGALDIMIDTTPPIVSAVTLPNGDSVFQVKPTPRPTPPVTSLLVTLTGGPTSAGGFSLLAVYPGLASDVSNYLLVGDHNGTILITQAAIVSQSDTTVLVRLDFPQPLPDDRFTLTLADAIADAANNALDGESQAQSPGLSPVLLPSGNGVPGGNFVARFTVDSRPEIGVVSEGLVYVDINGNSSWDPTGIDGDKTNRDFVFQFGQLVDAHFAGNFAATGAASASGYDKLGAYGRFSGKYSFVLDTNDDGVGDLISLMPPAYQVNGMPVAGNFSLAHPGDEIGLFDGSYWYIDANGNNQIDLGERVAAHYNGLPIVGDFNGDGADDLAVFVNDSNQFLFDTNRDGNLDFVWNVADDVGRFTGLSGFTDRPVAGDLNLDGIDDIGLWVKDRQGTLPRNSGEYFFWISD
ncbi:MAG: pre-peptidase C-terminal domain-containing protein, partial [Pirellulaceae bacterium]|nr:pre-peptidase C-terminal domain-containing protein [Pirellulaceae bacterium]